MNKAEKKIFEIRLCATKDYAAAETLTGNIFGPGRFAKTAYRLREQTETGTETVFGAYCPETEKLVGSAQLTPVTVKTPLNAKTSVFLLGPVAVIQEFQNIAVGSGLIRKALRYVTEGENPLPVLLVGDAAYYQRFGFRPYDPDGMILPGPADPGRVLIFS